MARPVLDFRPRIMPVLLLRAGRARQDGPLPRPTYIGDPINAVRLFNELKADELVLLDTMASLERR